MSTAPFRIELLGEHDRSGFDCGTEELNDYLRRRAGQDVRRRITACYVASDQAGGVVAGYYTLAACGIAIGEWPSETIRRLPRYPTIPAVRVGRLAIDIRFQGRRLGGALLFDALQRTCRSGIGAFAMVVDAKDERAAAFYEHHGFLRLGGESRVLFLPIGEALRKLVAPDVGEDRA